MAIKRVVSTDFWTDPKVVDMFSPEDKLFMLYLLTNPHANLLGIYSFGIRIASFETGYSQETIKVLLDRFEYKYKVIMYSHETQEIAILNWLKHSIIKGGTPVADGLLGDAKRVKDKSLIKAVFRLLQGKDNLLPTVQKFIDDYSEHLINTDTTIEPNINTNMGMDMGMDMELRERNEVRNASVTTTTKKPKPNRHKYGQYLNVLLSDEEMEKLMNEFPMDWQERIERLSEYVASTGKAYKNHLATIRGWARREKERNNGNGKPSGNVGTKPEKRESKFAEFSDLI